ncbi:hypothetical protein D3C86_2067850 [compost metagenome]
MQYTAAHQVEREKYNDHDAGSGEAGRGVESDGVAGVVGQWLCEPGDQRSRFSGDRRERLSAQFAGTKPGNKTYANSRAGGDQHLVSRRLF